MDARLILQAVASGILQGGVYSLICVGLTLIFGVMRIVNFAHGEFLMVGMYLAFVLHAALGLHPYVSMLVGLPVLFLLGAAVYWVLLRPIMHAPHVNQFLVMMGFSLVLQGAALWAFTADLRTVKIGLGDAPPLRIGEIVLDLPRLIAASGVVISLLLYWVITRTDIGRQIRAISDNREAAALVGIDVQKVFLISFGAGIGCLGLAGPLIIPVFYVSPTVGTFFVLTAFMVVIVGGMGNFLGAVAGSFLVAIADQLGAVLLPGSTAQALSFSLLVLVLLLRPRGLFGSPA